MRGLAGLLVLRDLRRVAGLPGLRDLRLEGLWGCGLTGLAGLWDFRGLTALEACARCRASAGPRFPPLRFVGPRPDPTPRRPGSASPLLHRPCERGRSRDLDCAKPRRTLPGAARALPRRAERASSELRRIGRDCVGSPQLARGSSVGALRVRLGHVWGTFGAHSNFASLLGGREIAVRGPSCSIR